eukprot:sb/3473818/
MAFILLLFVPLVSTEFLELCCTFTESTTREVKTLSTMVESVNHKVIMVSPKNLYEIKLDSQTSIGVSSIDAPLKFLLASCGTVTADSFDRATDSVVIGLETTSEGSFGKLSSIITSGYPAVEVVKQDITKGNVFCRIQIGLILANI